MDAERLLTMILTNTINHQLSEGEDGGQIALAIGRMLELAEDDVTEIARILTDAPTAEDWEVEEMVTAIYDHLVATDYLN